MTAALLTFIVLAGALLTVQPGREIIAGYTRFAVAVFTIIPFPGWLIAAFVVAVGAVFTLPLAVTCSAIGLTHRWTLRPILRNAGVELTTAGARRRVRRDARRNPTAGTVLIDAATRHAAPPAPSPAQIAHLPHSDTGSYMLVDRNGVPTLEPVR